MEEKHSIKIHDECAAEYDQQIREYAWFGHEILFGMCNDYVNPHDFLLDVGIGTGLGSHLFAKAGLAVFGIDGSIEMLNICKSKNIAKELKHFDLQTSPLPYSNLFFNHVISCGVLHFFNDLDSIFKEISRIIKPDGIFAFTIMAKIPDKKEKIAVCNQENYSIISKERSFAFMHSNNYIEKLMQKYCFEKLKKMKFLVWSGKDDIDNLFYAYVAQRSAT